MGSGWSRRPCSFCRQGTTHTTPKSPNLGRRLQSTSTPEEGNAEARSPRGSRRVSLTVTRSRRAQGLRNETWISKANSSGAHYFRPRSRLLKNSLRSRLITLEIVFKRNLRREGSCALPLSWVYMWRTAPPPPLARPRRRSHPSQRQHARRSDPCPPCPPHLSLRSPDQRRLSQQGEAAKTTKRWMTPRCFRSDAPDMAVS